MKSTPRNLIAMKRLDSVSPRLVWLGHSCPSGRRHIGGSGNGYFGRLADKSVRPTQAVTETFDVSRAWKVGQTAKNGPTRAVANSKLLRRPTPRSQLAKNEFLDHGAEHALAGRNSEILKYESGA